MNTENTTDWRMDKRVIVGANVIAAYCGYESPTTIYTWIKADFFPADCLIKPTSGRILFRLKRTMEFIEGVA